MAVSPLEGALEAMGPGHTHPAAVPGMTWKHWKFGEQQGMMGDYTCGVQESGVTFPKPVGSSNPGKLPGGGRIGCSEEVVAGVAYNQKIQLFAPLPGNSCAGCRWLGVDRLEAKNQASPRRPTIAQGRVARTAAGAAAGVCPWSPKAVCALILAPLEPPKLAGGLMWQK